MFSNKIFKNPSVAVKIFFFFIFYILSLFFGFNQVEAYVSFSWNQVHSGYNWHSGVVDPVTGHIYAAGSKSGSPCSSLCIAIARFSSSTGALDSTWGGSGYVYWDTTNQDEARAVSIDSSRNVYVTGFRYTGNQTVVVVKYNSVGTMVWQREFDVNNSVDFYDQGYGIAVNSSGTALAAGSGNGLYWFNPLTGATTSAIFGTSTYNMVFDGDNLYNYLYGNAGMMKYAANSTSPGWFQQKSGSCSYGRSQIIVGQYSTGEDVPIYTKCGKVNGTRDEAVAGTGYKYVVGVWGLSDNTLRKTAVVDKFGDLYSINNNNIQYTTHYGMGDATYTSYTDIGVLAAVINDAGEVFVMGSGNVSKFVQQSPTAYAVNHTSSISWAEAISTGGTIRASHVNELRTMVNNRRLANNMSSYSFTDPSLSPGSQIRAVHITDLRTATEQIYSNCSDPLPTWTDPSLSGQSIKAIHFNQLRNRINIAPFCPTKRVFVTASTHTGNLGGLTGADAICQSAASGAGLSGTYKSWISAGPANEIWDRFSYLKTEPIFRLPNNTVVAYGYNDLMDGYLLSPINQAPNGGLVTTSTYVWTTTEATGKNGPSGNTCQNYTYGVNGNYGNVGYLTTNTSTWTEPFPAGSIYGCGNPGRIYCIEQ